MKRIAYILIPLSAIAFMTSCGQKVDTRQPQTEQKAPEKVQYKIGGNTLDVSKITGKGTIRSFNTVPIYSVMDGIIKEMSLVEGQRVRKGEVLAVIDDTEARLKLSELESELQKKAYDVQSTLIGMGYMRGHLDKVPANERESVEIMVGYTYTKVRYDNLKTLLENHIIKAPFDGSILDIKVDRLFYARKGEPLFYLMDTEDLIVRFEVVETMLPKFSVGMPLEFTTLSFGDSKYTARLLSIAPNVENTGMVVMTARIEGRHPELRPGMTVFVNY